MSLDVSREICALGRGNMHVSRHKSSSMCSTREKINSSQRYLDWHLTIHEESKKLFFILRVQLMSRARFCMKDKRQPCKIYREKTQKERKCNWKCTEFKFHPVLGHLHNSPNISPHLFGFPVPFLFLREQSLEVHVHRLLNKSNDMKVKLHFQKHTGSSFLCSYFHCRSGKNGAITSTNTGWHLRFMQHHTIQR